MAKLVNPYQPREYWDAKARRFRDEPDCASCTDSHVSNQCITRVQHAALRTAIERLGNAAALRSKAILDFGCGSGRHASLFSELGGYYCGLDISAEMIDICRSCHPEMDFAVMEDQRIPFDSRHFDLAVSIAVLHHNPTPIQAGLLTELTRVIKPGGHLFLFEGVGASATDREFPRTLNDWVESVTSLGYNCVLRRRYQYYPVRRVLELPGKRIGSRYANHWRIRRLDAAVSPLLSRMVPIGPDQRAAMLFVRHFAEAKPCDA